MVSDFNINSNLMRSNVSDSEFIIHIYIYKD